MAAAYKASGTFTAGTGAVTPPYPTSTNAPVANDVALLVISSENEAISLTTANGFTLLGSATSKAAGTGAADPGSRLVVYWKRCVGSDSAPVVADSGNNTEAQIHLFSGCKVSGNPYDVFAEGNNSAANSTSITIPGATTTVANTLIVLISSTSFNGTSTVQFASWTNANLGSITERADNSDTSGLGGGHGMATGTWASTGAYGNSTVTLANTSFVGTMSIALAPEVSPTVALNTPADAATGQSTTPTLNFTGTDLNGDTIEYNVQIDTVNTFDSTSSGFDLKYADLWLAKTGTPSDNVTLEVRSGSISGSTLGTSAAVAASTATAGSLIRFTFATPVTLAASTQYFLVLSRSGANDAVNGAYWAYGAQGYSGGDLWVNNSGTWSQNTGQDRRFVLYDTATTAQITQNTSGTTLDGPTGGTGSGQQAGQSFTVATVGPVINASSSVDAGFTAGHPFTSGVAKDYTAQTALTGGTTYYWRVRAIDPSGSNTYGAFATTRSFTTSGGGSTYTLTAGSGTYTQTGKASNLLRNRLLTAATASYAQTGQAATLSRGYRLPAALGTYGLTGQATTLSRTYRLVAAFGAYIQTGQVAALKWGHKLTAAAGTFVLTGNAATLSRQVFLTAAKGAYTQTGNAANLLWKHVLTAATAAYALTGNAAALRKGNTLTAATGSYSQTGNSSNLLWKHLVTAATGAFTLTGRAANLLVGRKLAAATGSYVQTGNTANLLWKRILSSTVGSYVLTGKAAGLTKQSVGAYSLSAGIGSYSVTGNAASLRRDRTLTAARGSYVQTGNAITLRQTHQLSAISGTYINGQNAANLLWNRRITGGTGSLAVTGNTASLRKGSRLTALVGTYSLAGISATLTHITNVVPLAIAHAFDSPFGSMFLSERHTIGIYDHAAGSLELSDRAEV